jgi:CheY-like chemotaxis protein
MEKILIIDDDKLSLKVIKEILGKLGYKTLEAENGESGLQLVRSEHPDLVITDFQMPGIDGLEVLYEVRKLNIGLPVILLTGYGDVV